MKEKMKEKTPKYTIKDSSVRIRIRSGKKTLKTLVDWMVTTPAARAMLGRTMTIYGRIPGYACTRSRNLLISGWWIPRSTFTILDPQRKKKTHAKPSQRRA